MPIGKNTIHSSHEEKRVRELLRHNILDTPNEQEFDDLTKVAAYLCDVKYAHIHFLDHNRQWAKSCHGWNVREMPRDESICTHTIQRDKYMVVNNLKEDSRFKHRNYVTDDTIQFYAGIVLNSKGFNLGTLCVFDDKPNQLSEKQLESLQILGNEVEARLELRLKREELIDEHQKLRKSAIFLQNSTDLRLILDPKTLRIEEANEEVEDLLGYKPDNILGTPLTDIIKQDEFRSNLNTWAEKKLKQQFSSEIILEAKDENSYWFQITITEEQDKYYVTGRNITRRKRSEKRFLKQAKLTENIIQHLPGIFFLIDKKGRIKKWNNNLIDVAERTTEETKNQLYKNFIAREDYDKAEKAFQKVFETGYARTELNFISKNGKATPILLVGFRYQVDEGTYATGIGIDISDEKQALEELERKEQKLKEAQRIGRIGSWTWHIPTNEVSWSEEVYELYGLDEKNFKASIENFQKMLPEDDQKKVKKIVDRIMAGKRWEEVDLKVHKPDGSIIYVHQRGEVHYDGNGNPVEVSGTVQDVTARRENEEKLKTALKEKNILLAEVHHRVKNNLAIINSLLQLEVFNTENEQLKAILTDSQMRIHSMALIHETLYSFGQFSDISLKNYLHEFTESLLNTFTNPSYNIDIELHAEEVSLNINQAIPCALLINEIATNSLKHAFPNFNSGIIEIQLEEKDSTIFLDISDNGVGFDNDYDFENPTTLGFTLINKLTAQLDGDLAIESRDGTSFHISFPKKEVGGSSASYFPEKT